MNPNRWKKVDELMQAALDRAPAERDNFLTEVCVGDQALRQEIESLIFHDERAKSFLEVPAFECAATLIEAEDEGSLVGHVLGHYQLQRKIGSGGMGEVYLAYDTTLERAVALKVLPADLAGDTERLRRFTREAKAASALNHPNIITVHEIGKFDSTPFIVTEFVDGITLREKMNESRMPLSETLNVIRQIVDALSAAHEAGIIHRDIKPENIMLRRDGYVKVLDFGLAKLTERKPGVSETETLAQSLFKTDPGVIMGTVHYMSPEQARGLEVDARTDIWSLGVVFYEMTAGRKPFEGATPTDVIISLVERQPSPLHRYAPDSPDRVEQIIRKMLAKDPKERYRTITALSIDLKKLQRGQHGTSNRGGSDGTSDSPDLTLSGSPSVATLDKSLQTYRTRAHRTSSVEYLFNQAKLHKPAVALSLAVIGTTAVLLIYSFRSGNTGSPGAQVRSLVALPCKVYGAEEVKYLADAIPSTLSTLLSQLEGLETKVPPGSVRFDQVQGDLDKIATAYQVNTFVLTTVTSDSNKLILDVQLVEARNRKLIWGRQFQGDRKDYIGLVRQAAEGIRQTIAANATAPHSPTGLAANSEAELAFRQGRYYSNRYNNLHQAADFDIALSSFKRALELDPKLANAAAEIAFLYVSSPGAPSSDTKPQAVGWAQRALSINPKCARALVALVFAEEEHSHESVRKMFEYALRASHLDMQDALAQTALSSALSRASIELGLEANRESQRLDPLYLHPYTNIAGNLYYLGRTAEGLPHLERALEIEPDMTVALWRKAIMLSDVGRISEAAELMKRLESMVAEGRFPAKLYMIPQYMVAIEAGDVSAAEASLIKIMAIVDDPKTSSHDLGWFLIHLAPTLAKHGKTEPALHILSRCSESGVVPPYDWLMLNPHLETLRFDPRFKEIATRSRSQFDEIHKLLRDAQSRGELPSHIERRLDDLVRRLGVV